MSLIRRLSKLRRFHKSFFYFLILLIAIVYFLIKRSLFCTNIQAWQHSEKMCRSYERGKAVGSLCHSICGSKHTNTFKCHTFGTTKEAVFSVQKQNSQIVFKSTASAVKALHWFDNGVIRYPSEKSFSLAVEALVRNKLHITISPDTITRLTHLQPPAKNVSLRQKEMDNIWTLLQSNEYLFVLMYSDKDLFPQLLGTCGSYFGVEYLEPLKETLFSGLSDSKENWSKRLSTSIQILELLDNLESNFQEPLHLCDIKLSHFGSVKDSTKLKLIDLDGIFPKSVLRNLLVNVDKCETDDDCAVFDCRGLCLENRKCSSVVQNSNLQIICEKIFLGWQLPNKFIIPGLLLSEFTPGVLAATLRECAGLQHEEKQAQVKLEETLRERLVNILLEIEQSVYNEING